jgi:transposase
MRKPAVIQPWLSARKLEAWVRGARSRQDYQKRLAIWMTVKGPFPAHHVASLLVVSKQAVWLWVGQYNRLGPDGLQRQGRGGRRRAYLSLDQEKALLESLRRDAMRGKVPGAREVQEMISTVTGRTVSRSYVYRLFKRIGWQKLRARSRYSTISLVR